MMLFMIISLFLFFKSKLLLKPWILRSLLSHRPYFHTLFHLIHVFVHIVQVVLFLHLLLLTLFTEAAIAVTVFCHLVFVGLTADFAHHALVEVALAIVLAFTG